MSELERVTYTCFNARCGRYRRELRGMAPDAYRQAAGYPPTCRACGDPLTVLPRPEPEERGSRQADGAPG